MSELRQILDLWKRASAAGEDVCLATVVAIEGSAYRRPGARMLLTASGQRAGTISGGCLEAEVAKKAWWLTAQGASVQRYSSFFDDDGDMPYGLGCGGTVVVLLERGKAAARTLEALRRSVEERAASVVVMDMTAASPGTALILNGRGEVDFARGDFAPGLEPRMENAARELLAAEASRQSGDCFVEYLAPPSALFVFGAGEDAGPLVRFGAELGWHVTVADGRSQLRRPERFPHAAQVLDLEEAAGLAEAGDAAVIMTHSYEQDRTLLGLLLPKEMKYLGILGPRRRTERLMGEVAEELRMTAEECLARVHSPVGLDLGGHAPAVIALSIAAEVQSVFAGRVVRKLSGAPLIHA